MVQQERAPLKFLWKDCLVLPICVVLVAVIITVLSTMNRSTGDPVVVIVGSGLAGLSAAVEAAETNAKAKIILLEKEKGIGGNSAKASSGINGAQTKLQQTHSIVDSTELFIRDTLASGEGECQEDLVRLLAHRSADAIDFLQKHSVPLHDVVILGGHSVARTYRCADVKEGERATSVGWAIVSALKDLVLNKYKGQIEVRFNTTLRGLVVSEANTVTGVIYVTNDCPDDILTLNATAVILATGGYSADREGLLRSSISNEKERDSLLSLPTTNGAFARGEGVKIAVRDAKAKTALMNRVQVHPTGLVDPNDPYSPTVLLCAEAMRGVGGILLDRNLNRFVNELGLRHHLVQKIQQYGFPLETLFHKPDTNEKAKRVGVFLLLNEQAAQRVRSHISFYGNVKVRRYNTAKEFAEDVAAKFGEPPVNLLSNLEETFQRYNKAKVEKSDSFGKVTFPVGFSANEPLYVSVVTPSIHYTMGGVVIDPLARVQNEYGKSITGLYAAGEVTGGLHGANRLGGNSLLECVVFGRIAGKEAAST